MKSYKQIISSNWNDEYKKKLQGMSIAELDDLYTQLGREISDQWEYTEDVDKFRMVSEELDER